MSNISSGLDMYGVSFKSKKRTNTLKRSLFMDTQNSDLPTFKKRNFAEN